MTARDPCKIHSYFRRNYLVYEEKKAKDVRCIFDEERKEGGKREGEVARKIGKCENERESREEEPRW